MLGFIDYSQHNKLKNSSIWLALWFTSNKLPGSGIFVLNYLCKKFKDRNIFGLGLTAEALNILEKFGFKTGAMNHYYQVNTSMKDKFKVIKNYNNNYKKNKNYFSKKNISFTNVTLKDLKKSNFLSKFEKNFNYVKSKFFNNSYYDYDIYIMSLNSKDELLIILRNIIVDKSNILRVVDVIGNISILSYLGKFFSFILNKKNAEYVDLLNFGLDENHLLNAGFLKLNFKSKIIVPNYFEPFMQQNKLINYAYLLNNNKKKFFIYKADGDQERPNKLLN